MMRICLVFLQIGALSFGGGMAVLSMIAELAVLKYGWIDAKALSDLVALSEMTPGPIAVNAATFVGMKADGPIGAIVATLCCVIPGMLIAMAMEGLYQKGHGIPAVQKIMSWLRPAVIAVIAYGGLTIFKAAVLPVGTIDILSLSIFIVSVLLFSKTKLKLLPVLLFVGVVGAILRLLF